MSFAQPFTDYEILERVGAGAMGTVFMARQKRLDRIVALKVLRPSLARNARYVDRLRREAHIVAQFNHPNIVTGYDLGEEGGYHFFVMEYVEGKALKDLLQEWGLFAEPQVLDLGVQVARALDHAFGKGVIHRDIKPGNILIEDHTGRVKVTDLGLAKAEGDLALTRDGATVGTPQYISPEQARTPQEVDIRSDLYSLGATLYHMATGRPPFRGDGMGEVITKVLSERAPSVTDLNPDLSQGLSLVIRKLMAKDPALRYQTPASLLEDLARVQRDEAPDVDRKRLESDSLAPGRGRVRTHLPWVVGAVGGLGLLIGAVALGAALWGGGGGDSVGGRALLGHLDAARTAQPQRYRSLLEYYRERPADPGLQAEIEHRWAELVADLQASLDREVTAALGAGRDSPAVRWAADPSHWRASEATLDSTLIDPLKQRVGIPSLTPALAAELDLSGLDTVRERARQWAAAAREEALLAYGEHLRATVAPEISAALDERDFATAAVVLARAGDRYFSDEGPSADQLSAAVAAEFQSELQMFRGIWEPRIAAAEARVAAALTADAVGRLGLLRREIERGVLAAGDLAARLAGVQRALLERYPSQARFRPEGDPWPEVFREVAQIEQLLEFRFAVAEAETFADRRAHAYAALVYQGDAAVARSLLETGPPPEDRELRRAREEHLGVLIAAENVMDAVLQRLARAGQSVDVPLRYSPGRPVTLTPTMVGDEVRLVRGAGRGVVVETVPPSDVLFDPLLAAARAVDPAVLGSLAPGPRNRGVTLWACVSDDFDAVVRRQDADAFVMEQVWPIVRRVREDRDRFGSRDLGRALAHVQHLADRLAAGEMVQDRRAGLAELERQLAAVRRDFDLAAEPRAGAAVERLEEWVLREVAQARLEAEVAAHAPGAHVQVVPAERGTAQGNVRDHDGGIGNGIEVTYPVGEIVAKAAGTTGWMSTSAVDGAARHPGQRGPFADLEKAGLAVPDALPGREVVRVTWRVRLPVSPSPPLWVFQARGVALAVSYLGHGEALRTGLLPAAHLGQGDRLADAMQFDVDRLLRGSGGADELVRIIPGALVEFALEIRPVRQNTVRVRASLDGVPLAPPAELRVDSTARPPLTVLPGAPLEVVGIAIRTVD